MVDAILGWHWLAVGPEGQHILRDGRQAPADGIWLRHEGFIVPCRSGLHLSKHPMDALEWAPGPILCRVEGRGDKEPHGQVVREYLETGDEEARVATEQAEDAIAAWLIKLGPYEYATDSESGVLFDVDFEAACRQLDGIVTPDLIELGGWGWVEDHDGTRYTVG